MQPGGHYIVWLFQFHKGTIKTLVLTKRDDQARFQFHKGTIKTIIIEVYACIIYKFQFHKGTIKTGVETRV